MEWFCWRMYHPQGREAAPAALTANQSITPPLCPLYPRCYLQLRHLLFVPCFSGNSYCRSSCAPKTVATSFQIAILILCAHCSTVRHLLVYVSSWHMIVCTHVNLCYTVLCNSVFNFGYEIHDADWCKDYNSFNKTYRVAKWNVSPHTLEETTKQMILFASLQDLCK